MRTLNEIVDVDMVTLDDIDKISFEDEVASKELEHPCEGAYFLMNHIVFEEELSYFLTDDGLPVFCVISGHLKEIGKMQPTVSRVLKAKFLKTGISFVSSSREKLTFNCPEDFYRFIEIKPSIGANWSLFLEEFPAL